MTTIKILTDKTASLTTRLDGRIMDILRNLPGRQRWRGRDLIFETTSANIEYLRTHFPDAHWSNDKRVKEIIRKRDDEQRTRDAKKRDVKKVVFDFKTRPYDHQMKAFSISRDKANFALLMEMGTGKTKVIIDTAAYLFSKGEITCLLVAAPNGVHYNWINEQIPLHMPTWARAQSFTLTLRDGVRKHEAVMRALEERTRLTVIAVNIEALSFDGGVSMCSKIMDIADTLFAIDESTRIKTPGSRRTRNAMKLRKLAKYRRIMSGSPITKGVEDLYSQLAFLDEDILGFSSFYTFRARYCVMGGFEGRQIVGYRNTEEIKQRLDGHSFRVTKAECLDLPDKVYVERTVPLHPQQAKIYEQLRDDFMTEFSGGLVDASLAIVRLTRLQQVVCGHLTPPSDDPDKPAAMSKPIIPVEDNPRIRETLDLVNEAEGKVIIWARFTTDLTMLAQALHKEEVQAVLYRGDVPPDERQKRLARFKTDPHVKVFLGQPSIAGLGLNMVEATTVIYYSNSFDAEIRWQSEDRCHRIGQANKVTYIDLVSKGTVDRKVVHALRKKQHIADAILIEGKAFLEDATQPTEF